MFTENVLFKSRLVYLSHGGSVTTRKRHLSSTKSGCLHRVLSCKQSAQCCSVDSKIMFLLLLLVLVLMLLRPVSLAVSGVDRERRRCGGGGGGGLRRDTC